MSIELKIQNSITSSINSIIKKMKAVPQEAFTEFVKNTPVKSGNAKRKTSLSGKTIKANYAYAKRLDEGYSNQSPQGMSSPTEVFVQKRIAQILAGK